MRNVTIVVALLLVACGKQGTAPDPDAGAADVATGDATTPAPDAATDVADADDGPCVPTFLQGDEPPFATLDEYCLFDDILAQTPANGVYPFEPIAVLYADESLKARFIAVPPGTSIAFDAEERWTYPVGTILAKTFYFHDDARDLNSPRRLLETRLIVLREAGWKAYMYVWDEAQTVATLDRLGVWIELDRINEAGESVATRYRVPNENQCASCHDQYSVFVPLGPRAFQLNSDLDFGGEVGTRNQLEYWAELGILSGLPADLSTQRTLTDYLDEDADIDGRARSYLEVNCAHCHAQGGAADASGLQLNVTITHPGDYGVCRRPVAAGAGSGGRFHDIVPGDPDASIMVYRMSSTDPAIKMPELPTQTADDFGVRLISEWIAQMTPPGCP